MFIRLKIKSKTIEMSRENEQTVYRYEIYQINLFHDNDLLQISDNRLVVENLLLFNLATRKGIKRFEIFRCHL